MVKLSVQPNDFELDFFLNYINAPYATDICRTETTIISSAGAVFCTHLQAKKNGSDAQSPSVALAAARRVHAAPDEETSESAHAGAKESSPMSVLSPLTEEGHFQITCMTLFSRPVKTLQQKGGIFRVLMCSFFLRECSFFLSNGSFNIDLCESGIGVQLSKPLLCKKLQNIF